MAFSEAGLDSGEQSHGGRGLANSRDGSGRLPAGAALGFATLSHSNLKSYAKIEAAQGHNTRANQTPNARSDAPLPVELLNEQSGTYVGRVKAILAAHGAGGKPVKHRKNGVIACEDIYGASPEYWNRNGSWRDKGLEELIQDPVIQAALALAKNKHGTRLVSCSLHLDETSPHVHVISVPLILREHSKRGRKPKNLPRDDAGKVLKDDRAKVVKWTLDASSLRGRSSDLEKNHDEWAEKCKPFGLIRGAKGSEMTEEARRTRRSRQTGRSSLAEANARKERERLHSEAQDYEAEAKAKAEEAAEELSAANLRMEEANAALERAKAQERENQRIRMKLDAQKQKIDTERKKEKEALEEKQSLLRNQTNLISKLLDPSQPIQIQSDDSGTGLVGVDSVDKSAMQGSWDWLQGGLKGIVDRLSDFLARESLLERSERQNETRARIIEKVIEPDSDITFETEGDEIESSSLTFYENGVLRSGPEWFKASIITISTRLLSLCGLEKREEEVSRREADVSQLEEDLRSNQKEFDSARATFDAITEAMDRSLVLATKFLQDFRSLPESQRSPEVNGAFEAATELESDHVLSAYLSGKKGTGVAE